MTSFFDAFDTSKFIRIPKLSNDAVPYDAVDNYLYTFFTSLEISPKKVLILNDDTGVLSYLFREFNPTTVVDSYFAKTNIERNLQENNSAANIITSIDFIDNSDSFDLILIKIPKSKAYFIDQLHLIRSKDLQHIPILVSGMVKHISPKTKNIIHDMIGDTKTEKVYKKAILFNSILTRNKINYSPVKEFSIEQLGTFKSYSNTFSIGKIDAGTKLLLSSLPNDISGKLLDLGCGYGVISKFISDNYANVDINSVDISAMSVESTKLNIPNANVIWGDGATSFENNYFDVIISNPPFHLENRFSVAMGLRLFKQVEEKLKEKGVFFMVANSGLNYLPYLKKVFTNVTLINKDKRYSIFRVQK